jgi:glucose/arabinose dehydrogenase
VTNALGQPVATSTTPRAAGRIGALAVALTAVVALAACGGSTSHRASSDGAAGGSPNTSAPTGSQAPPGVTVPPADPGPGPMSLDGVTVRLDELGKVDKPVALVPRSGTDDLYVAEQGGRVRAIRVVKTIDPRTNAVTKVTRTVDTGSVLDLSDETSADGERGLLGIAFSSDGRRLYADYTDRDGNTHVVEFPMVGDRGDTADNRNQRELLFVTQPFPNHNGGGLAFGPDGFLYIGMGDGGGSGDPNGNGQNTKILLGKVLRIDPDGRTGDKPYAIPDGNPFADGKDGAPEVWLYGTRNPWRFSFDRRSGDLWVADVGQDDVEEVDLLPAGSETGAGAGAGGAGRGANLGWNLTEGAESFKGGTAPSGAVGPIFEYHHDGGNCAVIGGFVYRGGGIPALQGTYVFGDYCAGELRGLLQRNGVKLDERSLGAIVPGRSLTSFGQDADGELYALSASGSIYRVVAP